MTFLNFETYFGAEKIAKAKEKYFLWQVIELKKDSLAWVGTIRFWLYKVRFQLSGIAIESTKCPYDSRSRSRYGEHKLAVLFALRQQLDLCPALTTGSQKIPPSSTALRGKVAVAKYPVWEPKEKDLQRFTSTANKMLIKTGENILTGDYKTAISACVEVRQYSFSVDATGRNKQRQDDAGGVENGKFYLQMGGFFNHMVSPGTIFKKQATGQPPAIDLETLP